MRRLFIISCTIVLVISSLIANAQTFSVLHDTVYFSCSPANANSAINDDIVVSGAHNVTLSWEVIATNFPTCWETSTGICDNGTCYSLIGSSNPLLPTGTAPGVLKNSLSYMAGDTGSFDMSLSIGDTCSYGCYYLTVKLYNMTDTLISATETYMVCMWPTNVPTVKQANEVILYPNPAENDVNVVFDGNSDIKTIAIYNLIGKATSVFKVSGNSANLNIEPLPTGIYFVRLINSHGEVVQTRKFTKQ